MVSLKSTVSWLTHEITVRRLRCVTWRTSQPHTRTLPRSASKSRVSSRVTVDLPLPDGPTSPRRPPGGMRSERPRTPTPCAAPPAAA